MTIVQRQRALCYPPEFPHNKMQCPDDVAVLAWAARENRVLLSHDVSTLTDYAYQMVRDGQRMPGVFEVSPDLAIAAVIEDLLLLAECSLEEEWDGQIRYLPLR